MPTVNPFFSGLSLIIHGVIIVSALIANAFKADGPRPLYAPKDVSKFRYAMKRTLAISILIGMSCFMIAFTAFALHTGIRVGADEPQRQYAVRLASGLWQEYGSSTPWLEDQMQYTRPDNIVIVKN